MEQQLVAGLVNGSIYGIIALGIVMVYRGSRVLNFAQVEMGTFGMFVAYQCVEEWGWPWLTGAVAAIVVTGALSAAFEYLVVRRMIDAPRLTVTVATIGLLLLLFSLELKIFGTSPRFLGGPIDGLGPKILGYHVSPTQMLAFAVAVGGGLGINAFLRRTDFGLAVLASAQDANAVRMMGVRLGDVSQFTWITAGVLSAIAVLLLEPSLGVFGPGAFSFGANAIFIPALAAALLGGLTDLTKAFYGGLFVGVVQAEAVHFVGSSSIPGAGSTAVFVVIVAALLLRTSKLSVAAA